ncbi:MAG: hypothetical protein A4E49_03163 [Methanosaeta sp. PtaU1.Bin112]|nr:MAG: hypothetical protein A4E49_03163 [Methanosaeta sp. PtaU1.Bin112]
MPEIELDAIDKNLLRACEKKSGNPRADIIAPLLGKGIQRRQLYERLKRLESAKLIRTDREARRGRALCYIEDAGKDAIRGREDPAPKGGWSP